jgi:hypothetical protein
MLRKILTLLSGLLTAGGCSPNHEGLPPNQPGVFAITEVDSKEAADGTRKTWRAEARAGDGKPFVFRLELLLKPRKGESPFAFSDGAIAREPGADGTHFLRAVARAIEADGELAPPSDRVERLEFSTAILGTSLSRDGGDDMIGGRFSSKPGNWMAFKLFLADGEGEVYLNLEPRCGVG